MDLLTIVNDHGQLRRRVHWFAASTARFIFATQFGTTHNDRTGASMSACRWMNALRHAIGGRFRLHGFAYAHGVVHRDVEAGNVLRDCRTGRAMVIDFGIARVVGTTPPGAEVVMESVMGS